MCNVIDKIMKALSEVKNDEEFIVSIPITYGKGDDDARKEIQAQSGGNKDG